MPALMIKLFTANKIILIDGRQRDAYCDLKYIALFAKMLLPVQTLNPPLTGRSVRTPQVLLVQLVGRRSTAATFEDAAAVVTVDRGHRRSAGRRRLRLRDGRVRSIAVPVRVVLVLGGIGRGRLLGTYGGTHVDGFV